MTDTRDWTTVCLAKLHGTAFMTTPQHCCRRVGELYAQSMAFSLKFSQILNVYKLAKYYTTTRKKKNLNCFHISTSYHAMNLKFMSVSISSSFTWIARIRPARSAMLMSMSWLNKTCFWFFIVSFLHLSLYFQMCIL